MRGPVLPYLFCRPLKPIWIARQRDIIALPGKFLDGGAADAAPAPVITATFAMFIFLNMMFNEWPRRLVPRRPLNHAPSDDIAAQMKVADRLRRAARAQSYDGIAMRCAKLVINPDGARDHDGQQQRREQEQLQILTLSAMRRTLNPCRSEGPWCRLRARAMGVKHPGIAQRWRRKWNLVISFFAFSESGSAHHLRRAAPCGQGPLPN